MTSGCYSKRSSIECSEAGNAGYNENVLSRLHRVAALFAMLAVAIAGQCAVLCVGTDCGSIPQQQQTTGGCHRHDGPAKHNQSQEQLCKHQLAVTDRVDKVSVKVITDPIAIGDVPAQPALEIVSVHPAPADFEAPPGRNASPLIAVLRV